MRLPDDRFSPDMYQGGSVNEHQLFTTNNFIIQLSTNESDYTKRLTSLDITRRYCQHETITTTQNRYYWLAVIWCYILLILWLLPRYGWFNFNLSRIHCSVAVVSNSAAIAFERRCLHGLLMVYLYRNAHYMLILNRNFTRYIITTYIIIQFSKYYVCKTGP